MAVEVGVAVAAVLALRAIARSSGLHREPLPDEARSRWSASPRTRSTPCCTSTSRSTASTARCSSPTCAGSSTSSRWSATCASWCCACRACACSTRAARTRSRDRRDLQRRGIVVLLKGLRPSTAASRSRWGARRARRTSATCSTDLDDGARARPFARAPRPEATMDAAALARHPHGPTGGSRALDPYPSRRPRPVRAASRRACPASLTSDGLDARRARARRAHQHRRRAQRLAPGLAGPASPEQHARLRGQRVRPRRTGRRRMVPLDGPRARCRRRHVPAHRCGHARRRRTAGRRLPAPQRRRSGRLHRVRATTRGPGAPLLRSSCTPWTPTTWDCPRRPRPVRRAARWSSTRSRAACSSAPTSTDPPRRRLRVHAGRPSWRVRVLVDARVAVPDESGEMVVVGSGSRRSKIALPGALLARQPGAEVVEGLALA